MATMTTDNGTKTPTEMAKDIVQAAVEDKLVQVSGTTFQKLEIVVRYLNRQKIAARGDSWFQKNFDNLAQDAVDTLIIARAKAINDQLNKAELADKDNSFRELIARGIEFSVAYTQVYGAEAYKVYTVALADKQARK